MATINFVEVDQGLIPGNVHVWEWEELDADADVGNALQAPGAADKTVQVVGALGSSDVLTMQGSNDGTTWFTLTSPDGTALTWTDGDEGGAYVILENPRYIRPSLAVTTAADVDVYVCGRINR